MNRSDGALVRLITPIQQTEHEQDADTRLRLFIGDLGATLNPYLPSAEARRTTPAEERPERAKLSKAP